MDIEPRDIRYFAVVAEHQNVGRAAAAMDLSATALSKSLRRLEKSVGAKLVQRAPKGIALTDVGVALLARISPLQGLLNDVRREAADLARGNAGHINIGTNMGSAENFLARACSALSRETAKVTLTVTVSRDAALDAALRKGEIDLCISYPSNYPPAEFTCERLCDTQDVVIASKKHRLAKHKQVALKDLVGERWAAISRTNDVPWRALILAVEKHGMPVPVPAIYTNSLAVRLAAVVDAGYLSVATRQYLRQEAGRYPLVELPIKEMYLTRSMSIIYRKGAYLSPITRRLIDILKVQAELVPNRSGGYGRAG
jgi:DNA-binding transcriptional LysR family regulator